MNDIVIIDRLTKEKQIEAIYHEAVLRLLYGDGWKSKWMRFFFLSPLVKWPWISALYGYFQKKPTSKRKILPFIEAFKIDSSEFLEPISSYQSFNDFFIRKLKREARPIDLNPSVAVIPADGRYYFYSDIAATSGFIVKGKKFDLHTLLDSADLAREFEGGSMVMARLAPVDYHRFHFPCDCLPGPSQLINGSLHSVNPLAVRRNIEIYTQNKRTLCVLNTSSFGKVIYMEIGATNVGSIQETYIPNTKQCKGAEKGYFEFGASALILLFAKNTIQFDSDLLLATKEGIEIRCLLGQSMGTMIN